MTVLLKSLQKKTKHFSQVIATFNYQTASVIPIFNGTDIIISVGATSDNPVGKLHIAGKYNILNDMFYIECIGLITDSEHFFFQTLQTLHNTLTNIQIGLDYANKNKSAS